MAEKKKVEFVEETSEAVLDVIPLWKYFELTNSNLHKYTKAYLEARYRGIMKTREDWAKENLS